MRPSLTLVFSFLALLGSSSTAAFQSAPKFATKDLLLKQKFLFEIVHRIEDPLAFEEWIRLGTELIVDSNKYVKFDEHMEQFHLDYRMGQLLPQNDFFGAVVHSHMQQSWGLFNFFYYAKDWTTFRQNVCWARLHVNAGMFVYALNLAVTHRNDFGRLIMPAIYEIWPQHFFNAHFIHKAEKSDYDVWSRQSMYEKEHADIYEHSKPNYLMDWNLWQWWKLMGLTERWYAVDQSNVVREGKQFVGNEKWTEAMGDVKMFWMPVDYTRDRQILNPESKLSYYTEDVDRNAVWYYLNLDYAPFLDQEEFNLHSDRPAEWWMFAIRMFMARYNLERLSQGLGDIETLCRYKPVQAGYNPQLISWNGVPFLQSYNSYEDSNYGQRETLLAASKVLDTIYKAVELGEYRLENGTAIDMRTPEGYQAYCDMMQGNVNALDSEIFQFYYFNTFMYLGFTESDQFYDVLPSVFLNYETMWRDPLLSTVLDSKIIDLQRRYVARIAPYTAEELNFEGVQLVNVDLDELVTYFDYSDIDVSNLLNDKMRFKDGQFQWETALYARQQRLNHKPFGYQLTVRSNKPQLAVVRTFIGPKYNANEQLLPLSKNRESFLQIDQFPAMLHLGENRIERAQFVKHRDRVGYTEMYRLVLLALEDKYDFPLNISAPYGAFSRRLALPRGRPEGFPVQFFFIVTPYTAQHLPYANFDVNVSTGRGSGTKHLDDLNFGFPFDREIQDEQEFLVPNMHFKDTKIYHVNYEEKYAKGYENYGKFDYVYWKAKDIDL